MKIALYKDLKFDFISVTAQPGFLPEAEREMYERPGYARVSEWIDVEFPPLSNDAVIQSALRSIDIAEQEAREKFHAELVKFNDMRSNLLALTAPVAEGTETI